MVALIIITLISGTCENARNIVFVEGIYRRMLAYFKALKKKNLLTDMEKQVPINPFTDSYLYLSLLSCTM